MSLELRVNIKKLYPQLCGDCQKIMLELVEYAPTKKMIHQILMGSPEQPQKEASKKASKKGTKKG